MELDQFEQLRLYLSLNPDEHLQFWKSRISTFIEKGDYTKEQKGILSTIKGKLNRGLFDLEKGGLEEIKIFETEVEQVLGDKFNKEELKIIFASIKSFNKSYRSGMRGGIPCQCNGNSIWDCENCARGCSNPTNHGCGTFLLFSCGFECSAIPPNQE